MHFLYGQGCRSRPFWLEPEPFFRSGSGSYSYTYSYSYSIEKVQQES